MAEHVQDKTEMDATLFWAGLLITISPGASLSRESKYMCIICQWSLKDVPVSPVSQVAVICWIPWTFHPIKADLGGADQKPSWTYRDPDHDWWEYFYVLFSPIHGMSPSDIWLWRVLHVTILHPRIAAYLRADVTVLPTRAGLFCLMWKSKA